MALNSRHVVLIREDVVRGQRLPNSNVAACDVVAAVDKNNTHRNPNQPNSTAIIDVKAPLRILSTTSMTGNDRRASSEVAMPNAAKVKYTPKSFTVVLVTWALNARMIAEETITPLKTLRLSVGIKGVPDIAVTVEGEKQTRRNGLKANC